MMMSQNTDLNQKSRESILFYSIFFPSTTFLWLLGAAASRQAEGGAKNCYSIVEEDDKTRRRDLKCHWKLRRVKQRREQDEETSGPVHLSAEAGTADSSLRLNLFRKVIFHSYVWCFFFFSLL